MLTISVAIPLFFATEIYVQESL
ncbi:hypothetical protein EMIT0232MI5_20197 [Pseudomonas sp. IT-232MI5]